MSAICAAVRTWWLQVLTREDQRRRAVLALESVLPGRCGFHRVGRAPGVQVRRGAQAGQLLDRLVRRAVFAQTDGVVGVHINHALLHQRRHANGVAGVFHEHQEGRAVRHQAAVQGNAVHDGAHAELAHAVVHVVAAGVFSRDTFAAFPQGQVGTGQVSRAAEELRQQRAKGVQGVLAGFTAGDGLAFGRDFGDVGFGLFPKSAGSSPLRRRTARCRQFRELGRSRLQNAGPTRLQRQHRLPWRPIRRRYQPGFRTGRGSSSALRGSGRFPRCPAEHRGSLPCPACSANRSRWWSCSRSGSAVAFARGFDGGLDLFRIVAVNIADHLPVVGFETLWRVVGEPAFHFAVDGDAVVIVERDQLAQPRVPAREPTSWEMPSIMQPSPRNT
jgi:hypothetical protein